MLINAGTTLVSSKKYFYEGNPDFEFQTLNTRTTFTLSQTVSEIQPPMAHIYLSHFSKQ
jgi:hypothetical protein